MIPSISSVEALIDSFPDYLREAAYYCATPYRFQQPLAVKIIENVVKADYSAKDIFFQLIDLPFIYRHDEMSWQYTENARNQMLVSLTSDEKRSKLKTIHALVVNEIKMQLRVLANEGHADLPEDNQRSEFNSWQVRRLRWQLIYHLAPIDPEQAYSEFETIAKWANKNRDRLPIYKFTVEAWEKQARWLGKFQEEGAYFQGFYSYKINDFARAENFFSIVWLGSTKKLLMKVDAGHLLGVIYRQKGQVKWIEQAEEILRECLEFLGKEDVEGDKELLQLKARILNSLAATLIQISSFVEFPKAQKKFDEAEILLSESLRIEKDVLKDDHGSTHPLNTYSTFYHQKYVRLNAARVNLYRALEFINEALSLSKEGNDQEEMVHFNTKAEVLIQLGDENSLKEAEELLNKSLEINRRIRDQRTEAISYNKLGRIYIIRGDETSLRSSITWLHRSLNVWKELDNLLNQRECMEFIAVAYEQLDQPEKASSWRRSAYYLIG